jgi:hypothetical protein
MFKYFTFFGSLLFTVASVFTFQFNNPLCFSYKCYYDYVLMYLFGCVLFFANNLYITTVSGSNYIALTSSSIFVLGSTLLLVDLRSEGVVLFILGSILSICSQFYGIENIHIRLLNGTGSLVFISGSVSQDVVNKSILWTLGSLMFLLSSVVSTFVII